MLSAVVCAINGHREPGPKTRGYSSGKKKKRTAKCEEKSCGEVSVLHQRKKRKKKSLQSTVGVGGHRPSHAGQVVHAQHARILARHSPQHAIPTTTPTTRTTTRTRCRGLLVLQRDAAAQGASTRRVRRHPARCGAEALDAAQPGGITAFRCDPVDRNAPNGAVAPQASDTAPRMGNAGRLGARSPSPLRGFDGASHTGSALPFHARPRVRWP